MSSTKRKITPETTPEREAKRRHLESHSLGDPVKDEFPLDESITAPPASFRRGDSLNDGDVEAPPITPREIQPSEDVDVLGGLSGRGTALEKSIRILASTPQEDDDAGDLVHGAFQTVLKRRLKLVHSMSHPETPKQSLDLWLTGLLQEQNLPLEGLSYISARLRKAEAYHILEPWLTRHGKTAVLAAIEILENVLKHGEHVLEDLISSLRQFHDQPGTAKASRKAAAKTAPAKKTSQPAQSGKAGAAKATLSGNKVSVARKSHTTENAEIGQSSASAEPGKNGHSKQTYENVAPTARGKSVPLSAQATCSSGRSVSHPISSSPALDEFMRGYQGDAPRDPSTKRSTRPNVQPATSASAVRRFSPKPSPSLLVRYVRAQGSSLLVIFIGPSMDETLLADIDEACRGAYDRSPLYAHKWSESVWIAHMNNVKDLCTTNLVTLKGVRLVAENTNSDPTQFYVASCTAFDIDDETLEKTVQSAVAPFGGAKRTPGRARIHRYTNHRKERKFVFLQLTKAPPFPWFQVPFDDASDERKILFKPVIIDFEVACFYCDAIHEDFICPDAEQMSSFKKARK